MNTIYPYLPPEDPEILGRPKNRLEIQQERLRHDRMVAIHNAAADEAPGLGPIDTVRAAIGAALIAAGEQIGREALRRQRQHETARHGAVRHA